MFLVHVTEDGQVRDLTLGNRAKYDTMRATDSELIFLEASSLIGETDTKDFVSNPSAYQVLYGTTLIRTT